MLELFSQKYEVVEVKDNNRLRDRNFNAVLREVDKLQDQGWELFDTQSGGMGVDPNNSVNTPYYTFYMRMKRKQ